MSYMSICDDSPAMSGMSGMSAIVPPPAAGNQSPTAISPNTFSIDEGTDTTGGSSLGVMTTTDPDAGDTHTYSINGGADAANFSIGGVNSDELILTDGLLSYDTKSSYAVVVRTTDSSNATYDESMTISVTSLLLAKVGTAAQPAAAGNSAVTGLGFTPKAIICFGTNLSNTSSATDAQMAIGFAVSNSSRASVGMYSDDGADPTNSSYSAINSKIVSFPNFAPTNSFIVQADVQSFDSNGFTLNWSGSPANTKDFHYVALGGGDLTNAAIVEFMSPANTGTQDINTVGFVPDVVVFLFNGGIANWGVWGPIGFGAATSNTEQGCISTTDLDNQATSDSSRLMRTNTVIHAILGNQGTFLSAEYNGTLANGFQLNWTTTNATPRRCYALCLKGGQWQVGSETQATSVSTKNTASLDFTPKLVIPLSVCSQANSSVQTQSIFSIGAGMAGTANCVSAMQQSEDNAAAANTNRAMRDGKCLQMWSASQTLQAEAHVNSFHANGFLLDWTTADANARQFIFLAAGNS